MGVIISYYINWIWYAIAGGPYDLICVRTGPITGVCLVFDMLQLNKYIYKL